MLHHYNYLMAELRQAELRREAEYARFVQEATRHRHVHQWSRWLGIQLIRWGQRLAYTNVSANNGLHDGPPTANEASQSAISALKALPISTARSVKWN